MPCFMYVRSPEKKDNENRIKAVKAEEFKTTLAYKCQKHPSVPKAFFSPFTQRR